MIVKTGKNIHRIRAYILIILIIGIAYDIFLPTAVSDTQLWLMIITLIGEVFLWQTSGIKLIEYSLWLAISCSFFVIFDFKDIAERTAVWWYIFFTTGVLLLIMDYTNGKRKVKPFRSMSNKK